jgi:MFS family permease
VSRLAIQHTVDAGGLEALLRPRDDIVAERQHGEGRFVAVDGPFATYERRVDLVGPDPAGADGLQVVETIQFRLAVPFWWFLFVLPYRAALRRRPPPGLRQPWWAPPQRVDARAATVLGLLCSIAVVGGYLGTLITQTITFASSEFGTGTTAQGVALAGVRSGAVVALAIAALADRKGRRRLLLVSAVSGCVVSVTGALAPSLFWLGASQAVARGFATAVLLLVAIVSAEEMPAGTRAYAYSLITMAGALGAGMCLWALPLADIGVRAWRILYVLPLLGIPIVVAVARRLPESRRFAAPHPDAPMAGHGRRFGLLAVSGFLLALFGAPASQFQNEFLRDERGFSAAAITVFTIATVTPAAIGIVVGGHLADVRGRRGVGAVGIVGGTVLTVAMFAASGWPMWVWSALGSVIAGLVVPAMGVYRPELFPTSLRGKSAGAIDAITLAGSATGLVLVGQLADWWGNFARPIALVSLASLTVAVLVVTRYPETARRSLEDLNPEDRGTASVPG